MRSALMESDGKRRIRMKTDNRMINQSKAATYKEKMVGKRYRHFKGAIYIVTDIAIHSETAELMVIYKPFDNPSLVWARPLSMFLSPVDKKKYSDVKQQMRFEELSEEGLSGFYENMPDDFKQAVEVIKRYCQNEDCMEECKNCPYPLGAIRCGDKENEHDGE